MRRSSVKRREFTFGVPGAWATLRSGLRLKAALVTSYQGIRSAFSGGFKFVGRFCLDREMSGRAATSAALLPLRR